jgi:hypothetical protein
MMSSYQSFATAVPPPVVAHGPSVSAAVHAARERKRRMLKQAMLVTTWVWDAVIVAVPVISLVIVSNRLATVEAATNHAVAVPPGLAMIAVMSGLVWCSYWWALATFFYAVMMITLIVLYHCR